MDFHRVPNQVLYQAEPLPDRMQTRDRQLVACCAKQFLRARQTPHLLSCGTLAGENYSIRRTISRQIRQTDCTLSAQGARWSRPL